MKNPNLKSKIAIDLLLEDLKTTNSSVRSRAKEFECENYLNYWRDKAIDFLMNERFKI
jgi:hypothetical protein